MTGPTMAELKKRLYSHVDTVLVLREFFGSAASPPDLTAGAKITRNNLLAYRELARRIIDAGKDSTGVQAARVQQVEDYLKGDPEME